MENNAKSNYCKRVEPLNLQGFGDIKTIDLTLLFKMLK